MLVRYGPRGWCPLIIALASLAFAAEPLPVPLAGPGASREDVLATHGRPTGQSKLGTKEVLSYPQGRVTLENGRVERVESNAVRGVGPERPPAGWRTSYPEAAAEAARQRRPILALFTGSDWSVASRRLLDEVAPSAAFAAAFADDYVFLLLDFPMRTPLSTELSEQNALLRERLGVTLFPSLLVMSATGEKRAAVDLANLPPGESYLARVMAGVQALSDATAGSARPSENVPPAIFPAVVAPAPESVTAGLKTAQWLVVRAIAIGLVIAAVLFWLVGRFRSAAVAAPARRSPPTTISATGVPWAIDVAGWSKDKLCSVVAGLAEAEGHIAQVQPAGHGADILLKRRGEASPRVLVRCVPGSEGEVPVRRVRELATLLAGEGVALGWFVAPGGFAPDARSYGEQRGILLIDDKQLVRQLDELPPLLQRKVLERTA